MGGGFTWGQFIKTIVVAHSGIVLSADRHRRLSIVNRIMDSAQYAAQRWTVTAMRIDVKYRSDKGSIWLQRGQIAYGAHWYGKGPVRKRALLRAMMLRDVRLGAPWLWD